VRRNGWGKSGVTRGRLGIVTAIAQVSVVGLIVLPSAPAAAYVNPNFTPLHVEKQSGLICILVAERFLPEGRGVAWRVSDVLKGKPAASALTIDFGRARRGKDGKALVADVLRLVKSTGSRPAVLFGAEQADDDSLLHVAGAWIRLSAGPTAGTWHLDRIDTSLNSTFSGGTDMLIAAMRFILKFPGVPVMPVGGGVSWDAHTRIGKLPGKARALAAVDVNADGRLDVYAAGPRGDRVFVNRGRGFDVLSGLASASLAGAWADFDGDGRPDLASLTSRGLVLYLQTAPGRFARRDVPLPMKVESNTPALSVVDLDADGRPDVVMGAGRLPIVLRNPGGGVGFQAVPLAVGAGNWKEWGRAGPCLAADFDGDGLTDIVQCYEREGLFFRGTAQGTFAPGRACGAAAGKPTDRKACVGDLDGDGLLDILMVGGGERPSLLHNRMTCRRTPPGFEEVFQHSGEPGYIVQAGAHCAAVGDFNHDTFLDLLVGYADEPWQVFFNRGFRSFAMCGTLGLERDDVEGADKGQTAALWADVDADGAPDLVVALAHGEVYLSRTTLGAIDAPTGIRVKADKNLTYAGPINVRFFMEGQCLGVRTTRRWAGAAAFGLSEPGEYILTWRLPGTTEHTKKVIVEQGTVEVIIGRRDR